MHLNDQLGDCTCAADANVVQQQTFYGQGTEVIVPDSATLLSYEKVGGYVPGDPSTDQGALIPDALAYLKATGMVGHTIANYGSIDASQVAKIKTAIAEFGAVDFGVNLPNSAQAQFQAGLDAGTMPVWDYDPSADNTIEGGHCILGVGYTAAGFLIFTWSAVVLVTWAWWSRYGSEAWAVVSHDWVNAATGKDPEGVDLAVLGQEFAANGWPNPFPGPAPAPTPAPKPPWSVCGTVRRALRFLRG
jgi:hypothetical protein